jgi:hypothetical protein
VRLSLIEAFLDHDLGEQNSGGAARAAVTCGASDGPASPAYPQGPTSPPAQGSHWQDARVLALKAEWASRSQRDGPPPRYYGPPSGDNAAFVTRNAATFAERQANQSCFGCTVAQMAAQGPILHWECKHHGQDASAESRGDRVPGSGRGTGHRRGTPRS